MTTTTAPTQDELDAAIDLLLAARRRRISTGPVDPDEYEVEVLDRLHREVARYCERTRETRCHIAALAWPDIKAEAARSRYARACRSPIGFDAVVRIANAIGVHPSIIFGA